MKLKVILCSTERIFDSVCVIGLEWSCILKTEVVLFSISCPSSLCGVVFYNANVLCFLGTLCGSLYGHS